MVKTVAIRHATLEDAAVIASLMTELGYPATAAEMSRRIARLVERSDTATFLATDTGQTVGMICAAIQPGLHADAPTGQIIGLLVSEVARGRGFGRRLVAKAEGWLLAAGAERVVVTSHHRRTEAHKFYVELGYESTGLRFARELDES